MFVQAIQSKAHNIISEFKPQKIVAVALTVLGAASLIAASLLAPVATPLTTALLIGGASVFVAGFFLNFFTAIEQVREPAKGIWTNEGRDLDVALSFGADPFDMKASFTDDHKVKITWNDSLERIIEFNEIPAMITLVDKNSRFVYEKTLAADWLKSFTKVAVRGFENNHDTTRVALSFG